MVKASVARDPASGGYLPNASPTEFAILLKSFLAQRETVLMTPGFIINLVPLYLIL